MDNKLCFKCLESHNYRKPCPKKAGSQGNDSEAKDVGDFPSRKDKGRKSRDRDQDVNSNSLLPAWPRTNKIVEYIKGQGMIHRAWDR